MKSIREVVLNKIEGLDYVSEAKGLSRFWSHLQKASVGIITAFRSTYNKDENRKRNKRLEGSLNRYEFVKVTGIFKENIGTPQEVEVKEESFFVWDSGSDPEGGLLKRDLISLGSRFDQDSIIFKALNNENAILIGTKSNVFPGYGVEEVLGRWVGGRESQYMSRAKGRPFRFSESLEEAYIIPVIKWIKSYGDNDKGVMGKLAFETALRLPKGMIIQKL
jgi:hypothetical protein